MTVELRHLRLFLAIAEQGQITLAAKRLRVAQSAASTTLRQLESAVGAPLVHRRPGGIELTRAGEVLRARHSPALTAFEQCMRSAPERVDGGPPR